MSPGGFPWDLLGLVPTADEKAIRTAYAARVRQYRPDSHPLEFSRVREAYEAAMEQARYLRVLQEAEAAQEEEEEEEEEEDAEEAAEQAPPAGASGLPTPEGAPPSLPLPLPLPPDPVPVPWQGPAVPSADSPVPEEEALHSSWQPHEALMALYAIHHQHGGIAAAALLRTQLEQSARATIDARLDYEAGLLHALLGSEEPSLALVFEANRCLGWTERLDDVAHAFGDRAARRLALLADMADHWLYASQYSPNGWDRRLFASSGQRLPWWAAAGLLTAAHGTAAQWLYQCEQLELPELRQRLNARTLQRMQAPLVLAPDLGLALMAALLCFDAMVELELPTTHPGASAALVATALALGLLCCVGLRWGLRRRIAYPLRAALGWVRSHPLLGLLLLGGLLVGGALAQGIPWAPVQKLGTAALAMALASVLALAIGLVWFAAQGLETVLLRLALRPMEAVARQAFQQQRLQAAAPWRAPPLRERLRLVPAAWRAARAQKQRDRQRLQGSGARGVLQTWWWVLPLLAAVVNALSHWRK